MERHVFGKFLFIFTLCLGLCPAVVIVPTVAADAPEHIDPQKRAETIGDAVHYKALPSGHPAKYGYAEILIRAPMRRTLKHLDDYGTYASFLPNFHKSKVLSKRGVRALVYMEAKILNGAASIWAQMRIGQKKIHHQGVKIYGKAIKSNVERFHAHFEVFPVSEGKYTLVTLRLLVDPGLPVGSSLVTEENVKAARRALNRLKKRVLGLPTGKKRK